MPKPRAATPKTVHVHIENISTQAKVFQLSKERVAAALKRHPAVAKRVKVTVGWDLDIYDRAMRTAHLLVGWRFKRDTLASDAPNLRLIQLTGAGAEHLMPLDWLPEGVSLANNRGAHGQKAAEFALMSILMLNNYVPVYATQQREHRWERHFSSILEGRTLLVVGVGNMGGGAAKLAKRFGMHVLGIRRTGKRAPGVDAMHEPRALPKLLPKADFVLLTTPMTPATRHLMGKAELDLMRKDAGLINMARAGVVDYDHLARKLRKGELRGAVLDVFSPEPLPPDAPIWDAPNMIMTPHVSSDDEERYGDRTLDLVLDNAERLLAGKKPRNIVRADLGY
ncbi:MAG: D-2-hydroxyacid dehydrogenase [Alphaproteobacteria bacterium]|nr:D-2-hydroxyacid dehydrogenase [Alphaproteobacteria bacterium]